MIKKVLYMKADTNDADYISKETDLGDYTDGQVGRIRELCRIVMQQIGHNWPFIDGDWESVVELYKDTIPEADLEFFDEFVPFDEFGVHTIEAIEIHMVEVLESF